MATYFKDHMKESGLLTQEQYKKVLNDSLSVRGGTFYSALMKSGYMDAKDIVAEACSFFGYYQIDNPFETEVNFEVSLKIHNIDKIIAKHQFAVMLDDATVFVIADPEDDATKSAVNMVMGESARYALITDDQYEVFAQYQIKPKQHELRSDEVHKSEITGAKRNANLDLETTAAQKLLNALIESAIERRASDLHIRSMGKNRNAKVLLRVDGVMQEYTEIKANALENLRNLLATKGRVGGVKPDAPVEAQISVNYKGEEIDTRVNIIKATAGYDFVLRFITSSVRSISELGLSEENQTKYRQLLSLTKGLVLICGPTGSGKTTLLYAGLQEKLAELKVIFTMEDPVEITLPGIVQMNIKKEARMSYEEVFPSSLRHDPDIILIGEIRKLEVALNAIQASDTGHLVLSTLHANDAASAISRLINIGVDPYAFGDIIAGIVAQRLVRRVCEDCKEYYMLEKNHPWREMYKLGNGPIKLARGRGCAKCAGTGYFDRTAINEIVLVNPELRDAIQMKAPRSVIEDALLKAGFKSYIDDGIDKALKGITTLDEIADYQRDILSTLTRRGKEG